MHSAAKRRRKKTTERAKKVSMQLYALFTSNSDYELNILELSKAYTYNAFFTHRYEIERTTAP